MNLRTLIIFTLAIVSGLGTVVGVKKMQSGNVGAAAETVETVDVVVAAVDLPMLKIVKAEDVALKAWPKDLVPPGAILKVEEIKGKTIRQSKKMNQPIFKSDVDSGRGIDVLIPDGKNMRLVSILTPSEASNVAGLIQPGDHIDVNFILTSSINGDAAELTGGAQARMLLQNVLVVSVGQQVEVTDETKVPGPYQSVSLAVTPEQSLILQLAGTKGTLTLALRKTGDSTIVDVNPITLAELRALDNPSLQNGGTQIAENMAEAPPIGETMAGAMKEIWQEYSEASKQAMAAKALAAKKQAEAEAKSAPRMVDVYRRIRTYRGTTPGEILLRTQELRSVAEESGGVGEGETEGGGESGDEASGAVVSRGDV